MTRRHVTMATMGAMSTIDRRVVRRSTQYTHCCNAQLPISHITIHNADYSLSPTEVGYATALIRTPTPPLHPTQRLVVPRSWCCPTRPTGTPPPLDSALVVLRSAWYEGMGQVGHHAYFTPAWPAQLRPSVTPLYHPLATNGIHLRHSPPCRRERRCAAQCPSHAHYFLVSIYVALLFSSPSSISALVTSQPSLRSRQPLAQLPHSRERKRKDHKLEHIPAHLHPTVCSDTRTASHTRHISIPHTSTPNHTPSPHPHLHPHPPTTTSTSLTTPPHRLPPPCPPSSSLLPALYPAPSPRTACASRPSTPLPGTSGCGASEQSDLVCCWQSLSVVDGWHVWRAGAGVDVH